MSGTNLPRIEINGSRKRYLYQCSICGNDARYVQRTNHPVCNDCRKKLDNQKTKARRAAEIEEAYQKGREDAYTDVRENLARLVINEVIDYGTYETLLKEIGIENNEFFNFEGARELADTTTDCEDCEKRIRAEERKDVIEMIKLELHPCMECPIQDECNCDEQFDDFCRSEKSISFDDVLSALHKFEKEK